MNTGGEAAEQIVRMSLEGFEVAAKITGAGAKNIAILLYSILKEEKKNKGKARLTSMLRSGKEELRKIKESRKEQKAEINTSVLDKSGASDRAKSANGKTEHKQPQRKKKKPKSKETR